MDNNEGVVATPETSEQGETESGATISLSKSEYEELVGMKSAYGSLKREMKDIKKALETKSEAPQSADSSTGLVEKTYLRAAGITDAEEMELALSTAKKWGISVDKVVDDEDFKIKLDKHRTAKANLEATSNISGDQGAGTTQKGAAYWLAKGTPPTAQDVPSRKERAAIHRAFLAKASSGGKTFYND